MKLYQLKNGYYYIYYNNPVTGKLKRVSTKAKRKDEALLFYRGFKPEEDYDKLTMAALQVDFMSNLKARCTYKTIQTYKITFKKFTNFVGAKTNVYEIGSKTCSKYLEIRAGNSVYAARKDRINLNAMFNYAIVNYHKFPNPVTNAIRFRLPEKMPKFMTKLEVDKLLGACDNDYKDLINFAVNTGLRQAEIISLKISQIDFGNKFVILDNENHITKSKKVRSIPLNDSALASVIYRVPLADGTIFYDSLKPFNDRMMQKKLRIIFDSVGLHKYSFHSLRHTFASWLVQAGVSIFVVKELLGHSDIKTTMIYAKLNQDNLRDSVNRI